MKYERQDKLSDEQRLKDNYGKREEKETDDYREQNNDWQYYNSLSDKLIAWLIYLSSLLLT